MDELPNSTLAILALSSLLLSIICAFAKNAYANFSAAKLEELLKTERAKQRLSSRISRSIDLLIATGIVEILSNAIFIVVIIIFFSKQGSIKISTIIYTLPLSVIPLAFITRFFPIHLSRIHSEKIMKWTFPAMEVFYWLAIWIVWPLSKIFHEIVAERRKTSPTTIEKEILHAVTEGEKEGFFERTEKNMIEAIIDLREVEAKEIMTPRTDMVCISLQDPLNEAMSLANTKGHSRIPVYGENRDDIVGVFYVKDLLHHWREINSNQLSLKKLMRKPHFVPETKPISNLLKEFQEQKRHIAIVLDEYGGTAGLVTIEDIMEEIVGEILDEYDAETIEPISRIDKGVIEVDARMRVEELNEELTLNIPEDDGYETLGGFISTHLGRIPVKDETHNYENWKFVILNASDRRIHRVKIIKNKGEEDH